MKVHLKLTRVLYQKIKADLEREHPFAGERVGFAYSKVSKTGKDSICIFLYDYRPVADSQYARNAWAGATIKSEAIRTAIQGVLDQQVGCFHVHAHLFPGKPGLSPTDEKGILPLIPSFKAANGEGCHGILLLSEDSITSYVWLPDSEVAVEPTKISIVGSPLQTIK